MTRVAAGIAAALLSTAANTATLTGSISFDAGSGLYTYSYTVDDTGSTSTVWNLDVFVGAIPAPVSGVRSIQPLPVPYTAPSGWTMYGAFSGTIAYSPYDMGGGFYEFYDPDPIQPGTVATGFSFTTRFAPADGSGNNFFLYGSGGILAYGNTIAPSGADWFTETEAVESFNTADPIYATTPLPPSWSALLGGLWLLGWLRRMA